MEGGVRAGKILLGNTMWDMYPYLISIILGVCITRGYERLTNLYVVFVSISVFSINKHMYYM